MVAITILQTLKIMGETEDTSNDLANVVTITNSLSSDEAGGDDESGTLRVHTDSFSLYNINVKNEVSFLGVILS